MAGFHYAQERIGDSDGHALDMPMLDEDELDLVPTEDLLAAIERRVRAYVMIVDKKMDSKDSEQEISYSGGYIAAIGLCEYAKSRLLSNHCFTPPHGEGT